MRKLELLSPAGSMVCLKAAISKKADSVYLGMDNFGARSFATNFDKDYLSEAVKLCHSNYVKVFLTMNTLVKNNELKDFFNQLSFAYLHGIDSVIIQDISFVDIIKKTFPDLRVHISTQAGVMNSSHANFLLNVDRINLARELSKGEIKEIRSNVNKELEVFCHGALCTCVSGQCLFSSFLGGRSGNRGKCAQPCRKKYDGKYLLSTKELCLINEIPEILNLNLDSVKIEGRMRTPYYVATATDEYRKAIDNSYKNKPIDPNSVVKLKNAFSRDFTKGWFNQEKDILGNEFSSATSKNIKEIYKFNIRNIKNKRKNLRVNLPFIKEQKSTKELMVRVYNKKDAILACSSGADVICFDLFDRDFNKIKESVSCKLFGVTPRIMLDTDKDKILNEVKDKNPDGLLIGNVGVLNFGLDLPIYLDYNLNVFNDINLEYFKDNVPIISPELSLDELKEFKNKNFFSLVHGKIKLMTLRHDLKPGKISDEKGSFFVNKIHNGSEIINEKELGLLSKSSELVANGINKFFVDTDVNVESVVKIYRNVLDGKNSKDARSKKKYVLGWFKEGIK
jgi:collagenase-like PrtC family protease